MIREIKRPSPLLVRPGATATPVRLVAPLRAFSLAAIAADPCDVAADAAIATAIELVGVAPHADEHAVRSLTVALRPSRRPPERRNNFARAGPGVAVSRRDRRAGRCG